MRERRNLLETTIPPATKKFRKALWAALLIPVILLTGIHFFVVYKAKQLLPTIVSRVSDGKYTLTSAKVRFHYFSPYIKLVDAHLRPATPGMDEEYEVKVDSLYLSIESIIPIFINKAINVKEVRLVNPSVVIRKNVADNNDVGDYLIHKRVGAMQRNTILVLNELSVNNCRIVNGRFQFFPFPGSNRHYNLEHINLSIDDLVIPPYEGNATQDIEGRIRLEIREPNLQIADSLLMVGLDNFVWDNQEKYLNVGKFQISQHHMPAREDSFMVALDTIRIRRVNWQTWLDSGIISLDTLMAANGDMYFESNGAKRKTKDSSRHLRESKVWDDIGKLDVNYFSARYISAAIINNHPGKERSNSLIGDSLVVEDLSIRPERKDPLMIGNLGLGVREFLDRGSNIKFQSSFSRMHLRGDTMTLNNYLVQSTAKSRLGEGSSLFIPALSILGLSIDDLMDEKATVREVRMDQPELVLHTRLKQQETGGVQLSTKALEEIRPYVDVERVVLNNAKFTIHSKQTKEVSIGTQEFSAVILSRAAMGAKNMDEFFGNFRDVELRRFFYITPRVNLELFDGEIDYAARSLRFAQARGSLGNKRVYADLYGVQLTGGDDLHPFDQEVLWHFRKLGVDSGSLRFILDSSDRQDVADREKLIGFIDSLDLRSVQVQLQKQALHASMLVERAQAEGQQIYPSRYLWNQARMQLKQLKINNGKLSVLSREAELIAKGNSVLREAEISLVRGDNDIRMVAPEIRLQTKFSEISPLNLAVEDLTVVSPVISFARPWQGASAEAHTSKDQRVLFRKFSLLNPQFNIRLDNREDTSYFDAGGELVAGTDLHWEKRADTSLLTAGTFQTSLSHLLMRNKKEELWSTGELRLQLDHFSKYGMLPAMLNLNSFDITRVEMHQRFRRDTMELSTGGVSLGRIPELFLQKDSLLQTAFKIPPTLVKPGSFVWRSPGKKFSIQNLVVNTAEEFLAFDSLEVYNRTPRDSFFARQPFEKDYITFSTGRVRADALRPVVFGKDTAVSIRKLTIDPMYFKVERDKRVKDDTTRYRPLLTNMLQRIPFLVSVDTIQLQHSLIWHNVIDEKTEKEGTIFFTDLHGNLTHVSNYDVKQGDSLRLNMASRLMGVGELRVQFREAYLDSLQGFLLSARMGTMDMKELNRLMMPLFNVRADRGKIQSLSMRVKGTDDLAYGNMVINYNKLKVSVLNEENKRRTMVTWLANLFVRGKNSKMGIVYAERLKEKSIFNFWARISVQGLLTNLGVRKNGKQVKRFYRGLEKHQLPPDLF